MSLTDIVILFIQCNKQLKFNFNSLYLSTKIIKTITIVHILLNPICMILTATELNFHINYVSRHYLTLYHNLVALICKFINAYFYPSNHRTWSNNILWKKCEDWLSEIYVLNYWLIQTYLFIQFTYIF